MKGSVKIMEYVYQGGILEQCEQNERNAHPVLSMLC